MQNMSENRILKKVRRIRELEEQRAAIDAEMEALKDELKEVMTAAGTNELRAGDLRVTWKEVFSNRIDSKALKAELPNIYERFLRTGTTRRFLITA